MRLRRAQSDSIRCTPAHNPPEGSLSCPTLGQSCPGGPWGEGILGSLRVVTVLAIPMTRSSILRLAFIGLLTQASIAPATAQDGCWDPIHIDGTGSWALDNTSATPSGFMGCGVNMWRDVFYEWTAPATAGYVFETCGSSGDTLLAVYSGVGCLATCHRFNDDACGVQSQITFGMLQAGDQVLVQVGGKDLSTDVIGQLTVRCMTAYNDNCADAHWFWGKGVLPYDNGCATTSGINAASGSLCDTVTIEDDVFFVWVPTYSGAFWIGTQSSDPTADTLLKVYQYTDCGNLVCVGSDDNSGPGLLSQVHLPVIPLGFQYLIQVGSQTSGTGGPGMLVVEDNPCSVLTYDAFSPNQHCWEAQPLGNGSYSNLAVGPTEPDYFELLVASNESVNIQTVTEAFPLPLELAIYNSASCPNPTVSGCGGSLACGMVISPNSSELLWTNPSNTPTVIKLRVMPPPGTTCLGYSLILGGLDGDSTISCNPSSPNSTGLSCSLSASSFSGPEYYHLEAVNGPAAQFGYFIVSGTLMGTGTVVSDGVICLDQPIGRYNSIAGLTNSKRNSVGQFNRQGVLVNCANTSSVGTGFDVPAQLPFPPGGFIQVGQTWYFQLWYRDDVRSNFSDVVGVAF